MDSFDLLSEMTDKNNFFSFFVLFTVSIWIASKISSRCISIERIILISSHVFALEPIFSDLEHNLNANAYIINPPIKFILAEVHWLRHWHCQSRGIREKLSFAMNQSEILRVKRWSRLSVVLAFRPNCIRDRARTISRIVEQSLQSHTIGVYTIIYKFT